MKFKLYQEKFEDMLEKLYLSGVYPQSVITVRLDDNNNTIIESMQREDHGRCFRHIKFNSSFFNEIDKVDRQESIEIDVQRILKVVKQIRPGTLLTVETSDNKLNISGEYEDIDSNGNISSRRKVSASISFREPEVVNLTSSISTENGITVVGKNKTKLDTKIIIDLEDLKEATRYASTINTEFYKFSIDGGELTMRIGDLYDFSDFWEYQPRSTLVYGRELSLILTFGLKEVSDTFRSSKVVVQTASNSPAWITEDTDEYFHGVLIPPFIQENQ